MPPPTRHFATAATLAAALLVTAAGCGDRPAARAPDGTISIRIADFRLRPQVVQAPSGRLTVTVRNTGRLPHNFRIRGLGGTRLKISTLLPGERATRSLRLPKGDWRMFCSIANHEELGLYGTLVLR